MMKPRLLDRVGTRVDITGGAVRLDESDLATVQQYTGWHVNRQGYAVAFTWRPRKSYLMHRVIMNAPAGSHVDHINGIKLDNRRSNLRVTTPSLNQVNRKRLNKNNSSGVRGVAWSVPLKKWRAQITANRKNIHLGLFSSREEAIAARRAAELTLWGEAAP